jgi:hypothetical protein
MITVIVGAVGTVAWLTSGPWDWWKNGGADAASNWWSRQRQQRAVRSSAGIPPAAKLPPQRLTHLCRDGYHDHCTGLIATKGTPRHCDCSCHVTAVTRFCAGLNRHDLCPGAVVIVGGAAPCGCTCHARRPIVERPSQITHDRSSSN